LCHLQTYPPAPRRISSCDPGEARFPGPFLP
jgi:hypothetical protein